MIRNVMAYHGVIKIFAFVLAAAILEASGDAILRLALHHQSLPSRVGLFLLGSVLLALYGTSLNLAPVDFATVTGVYVATVGCIRLRRETCRLTSSSCELPSGDGGPLRAVDASPPR
jgi:hypothetical protein